MQYDILTPARQAQIYATGLVIIYGLGIVALISLIFAAIWLAVQFVALLLTSAIEAVQSVGNLYQTADPLVKFALLVTIGFLIWLAFKRIRREL